MAWSNYFSIFGLICRFYWSNNCRFLLILRKLIKKLWEHSLTMGQHGTLPKFIGNTELVATVLLEHLFLILTRSGLMVHKILQRLNGSQLFKNTKKQLQPNTSPLITSAQDWPIRYDDSMKIIMLLRKNYKLYFI